MADVSALTISDSESDSEIPKFDIPAFKKYASSNSKELSNSSFHNKTIKLSSALSVGAEYYKTSYVNLQPECKSICEQVNYNKEMLQKKLEKNLENSMVVQPGFEKLEKVPVFQSKRQIRKLGLKERDKTKGFGWFNMPAPEMTEEKKNDLLVIQMRQALDPKHFYKRSASKGNPKYFQVGTFVESPVEFYSSRIPKKQRKQTLVEELLSDAKFRQYQKKKYTEMLKNQPAKFLRRKKTKVNKLIEARDNSSKKNAVKKGKSRKNVK